MLPELRSKLRQIWLWTCLLSRKLRSVHIKVTFEEKTKRFAVGEFINRFLVEILIAILVLILIG